MIAIQSEKLRKNVRKFIFNNEKHIKIKGYIYKSFSVLKRDEEIKNNQEVGMKIILIRLLQSVK